MRKTIRRALVPISAILLASGCATGPSGTQVTRYHLNTPISKGSIAIVSADPALSGDLRYQAYAEQVAGELRTLGFTAGADPLQADYLASVRFRQTTQTVAKAPPFSIGLGLGGGSYGRGGGVGLSTGVQVPIGGGTSIVAVNELMLQIRRRADQTVVWEGTAIAQSENVGATALIGPGMAKALFSEFPGASGKTVVYKR